MWDLLLYWISSEFLCARRSAAVEEQGQNEYLKFEIEYLCGFLVVLKLSLQSQSTLKLAFKENLKIDIWSSGRFLVNF